MSLPTDIIQLFGTGSVPAIIAGSALGLFELGERFASQRAKDALSKWLLTFDVQKAKALPEGTQELFERIFGERHFSWKCFIRSAAFSLGAMAFVAILWLLISPHVLLYFFITLPRRDFFNNEISSIWGWFPLVLWLPWSIITDYISLFKTRVILRMITRLHQFVPIIMLVILVIDFVVYVLLFVIGFGLVQEEFGQYFLFTLHLKPLIPSIVRLYSDRIWVPIFFESGFAPSIWMWLYVLALFVTRGLLRSEKLVNWLRWALDVEKNPFRSIGAVAAALAFIASVAVILVSLEVSRISATS